MELKNALKGQYWAGLKMLRECIELCPDALWSATQAEHPRATWRIAYHAIFYTHWYLMTDEHAFQKWDRHVWHAPVLWDDDERGIPPEETPYSQTDLLEYVDWVASNVGPWVDALDLDAPTSGFWYKIPKLDHQLVNLRHLGIHIGQLQELLYAEGIDLNWVGVGKPSA